MPQPSKFPGTIYVDEPVDRDNRLEAFIDCPGEGREHGDLIGVYVLEKVMQVVVKTEKYLEVVKA